MRVLPISSTLIAIAALVAGCGTQRMSVSKSDPTNAGAVLFSQRCAGCHTLSYAATRGSAANVRTAQNYNGPNFDTRCERPVTRVLYAIQNGGFSGGIMPQNVVVGHDAVKVAEFVAKYAGRRAPSVPGVPACQSEAVGTIPSPTSTPLSAPTTTPASTNSTAPAKVPAKNSTVAGKGQTK